MGLVRDDFAASDRSLERSIKLFREWVLASYSRYLLEAAVIPVLYNVHIFEKHVSKFRL
jgi:hypothetical protein